MNDLVNDYMSLNTDTAALSEADLELQLNEQTADVIRRGPSGVDAQGDFKLNANDIIARSFIQSARMIERQEAVDSAVKTAANGVKILAPILQAVSSFRGSSDEANRIMSKTLMRAKTDTAKILEAYGLEEHEAPAWLSATISGQIITLITNALGQGNTAPIDKPQQDYIQPLINAAKAATELGATTSYVSASPQLEMLNSLTMATAAVMAEYQSFNYFHTDAGKIAKEISTYFDDRVIRGTVADLSLRFALTSNEQSYLANTLLTSAGSLMANQWKVTVPDTLALLRDMSKEVRQASTANGYPLEGIIEKFEAIYQGLELSCENAIRTLNPGREVSGQAPNSSKSHGLA